MKKTFIGAVLFFATAAFAADGPSLAGKWTVHLSIAGNESDQECTLSVADKVISGSCKADDKENPVKGTIDGTKVMFYTMGDSNGTELKLTYKATVEGPGKFSGTVDVDPYNVSGEFTATPVK